jgi:hypothetical protein
LIIFKVFLIYFKSKCNAATTVITKYNVMNSTQDKFYAHFYSDKYQINIMAIIAAAEQSLLYVIQVLLLEIIVIMNLLSVWQFIECGNRSQSCLRRLNTSIPGQNWIFKVVDN